MADVTERLQLEAIARDTERFAANGKLAAIVAHEVNTPLHTIKTSLYLSNKGDEAKRSSYLKLAEEEIDRVSHILRQLLDLYRSGSGTPLRIEVNELIERMLLLTGSNLAKQGITVERQFAPDLPPIWGHADQITQVLLNIILNAIDAMPSGGHLILRTAVTTDAGDERVELAIADNGIGMAPEVQARIFDPFFTTKPNGSGLGLVASKKIVADHGGRLTIDSVPEVGSTFTITLPVNQTYQEPQP
jgi:signal transduction histidine kinase